MKDEDEDEDEEDEDEDEDEDDDDDDDDDDDVDVDVDDVEPDLIMNGVHVFDVLRQKYIENTVSSSNFCFGKVRIEIYDCFLVAGSKYHCTICFDSVINFVWAIHRPTVTTSLHFYW